MLLLCYLLLFRFSTAVTIESTFIETFLANGSQGAETRFQQNTVTLQCSNRDFRDTSLQQDSVYYDVFCQPPKFSYATTLRGFVPRQIRRYTAETCEGVPGSSTDPSLGNATATGRPNINGRRLLSFFEDIKSGLDSAWDFLKSGGCGSAFGGLVDVGLIIGGVVGGYATAATGVGAVIGAEAVATGVIALYDGAHDCHNPPPPAGPNLHVLETQLRAMNLLKSWIDSQQVIDATLVRSDLDGELLINATRQTILATQQTLLKVNQTIGVVAEQTTAELKDVQNRLLGFISDLSQEHQNMGALSQRQQLFANITTKNFVALATAMQQMTANASDDFYGLLDRNQKTVLQIRQYGRIVSQILARINIRRLLTQQIFRLAELALTDGLIPFWDPDFPGKSPTAYSSLSPAQKTIALDVQYINFINGTSPQVHQVQISYLCGTLSMLEWSVPDPSWMDLLNQLGPITCAALPGNVVDNCNCWLQINHTQCAAASEFNWQQIRTPSNSINGFILPNNPTYCSGVGGSRTTPGPWNGVLIDNPGTLNQLLSQLCNVQLSEAVLGGGPTGVRKMQLVSTRLGVLNLDTPSNPALTCKPNYDYIFQVAAPEHNVVFSVYAMWTQAQNLLMSDQTVFESLVYGIPPNGITYQELPFQRMTNNRTYICHRASFLAVSEDTRPVFSLVPQATEPVVSITGYTTPPVCDDTGCIFGQPAVVQQTTSDVVATVPFNFLLPKSDDAVVGEWRTHGIPTMTVIADVPRGGTPLTFDRRGTATYLLQSIPPGYHINGQTSFEEELSTPHGPWPAATLLDQWQPENPFTFSALDATLPIDLTEIDFVNGECVPSSTAVVKEWACRMFDHFALDPLTDMRQGRLVVVPREWSYVVTLNINMGEIVQRVFPGCPKVQVTMFTNGYEEIVLTNSLPTPVSATLHFEMDPLLCPAIGDMHFKLQPKQVMSQIIFGCPTASITVSAVDSSGLPIVCAQSLNISFVQDAPQNVPYFTDDTTVAPILSTAVVDQFVRAQQDTLAILRSALPLLIPSFTPDLTILARDDAIAALFSKLNRTLYDQLAAAKSSHVAPITATIAPLIAQLNALHTQAVNAQTTAQAAQAKLVADAALLARQVANQSILTNETVAAITVAVQAELDQLRDLQNADGGSTSALCGWCTNWLSPAPPTVSLSHPGTVVSTALSPVTSAAGDVICPLLCSIVKILIGVAIFAAIACCIIQCAPMIIKACCSSSK